MKEFIIRDGKKLRLGYTTGSCAAAAAKAAAWMLLSGSKKESIRLLTPKGMELTLAVEDIHLSPNCVRCAIRKDSGDDPDITRDTLIYAEVRKTETVGIVIDGGQGVGRVTMPGLDQPVGAAAINSVPRRMIQENVEEVCGLFGYIGGLYVVISAPDGETLAKKTFNPRLGIEGGISILGTTGIVEPMSEQALVDTIHVELRQRREGGADYVLLAPGNYGADYIKGVMGIDPATAVMTSNFIGDTMEMCRELGFRGALLIGHIGKLVKLAGGMWNTHSRYGDCRMDILTACAAAEGLHGGAAAEMLCCATCDDALRLLKEQGLYDAVLHRLAGRIDDMMHYKCSDIETGAILFSKEYGYLCETKDAAALLRPDKGGLTMVHFVGAGSGAADLITVRGAKLLSEADVVIYAGSLVNPALLDYTREGCEIHDSAKLTLEEVIALIEKAEAAGKTTVRLHTGDSSIYGAVREQFDELEKRGIAYDVCPGVSAFCGAAAALRAEYTLPDVSQTVIITRAPGRTPVPERESIRSLAAHQATMVLFLSTSLTEHLQSQLLAGGYAAETPVAVVYKATWPEEKIFRCTVGTLHETVTGNGLTKTSLIVVGNCLGDNYLRSLLYHPDFTTEFRKGAQ